MEYMNKVMKIYNSKDLIDNFTDVTQLHIKLIDTFNGKELKKLIAVHPFMN